MPSDNEAGDSRESTSCEQRVDKHPPIDQNTVNMAILQSLERLCVSIDNNQALNYYDDQYDLENQTNKEPDESVASVIDIQSDIESITKLTDVESPDNSEKDSSDNILEYGDQLDVESDTKSQKINEKVATVVNKLSLKRISQEQSKSIMKRHCTPENINVCLPKCEQSIWNQLPGNVRVNDVKFQSTQALILSSINCQLKVSEALLALKADKETITTCLGGLSLSMTANYEINQRRRDAIKPQFKVEFAKGLCTSSVPANVFLFGGDTAKRVREIAEINKSRVCKSQFPSRGKAQRFVPYNYRGYKSSAARGRGRPLRGRGSYSNQNFQQLPQPDKKSGIKLSQTWYVNLDNCNTVKQLTVNQPEFRAGSTKYHTSEWASITSDPEILDYIEHCHIEFIDNPAHYSSLGQQYSNEQQSKVITAEVNKLLQLGASTASEYEPGECLSPVFVTPKPDGSYRLVCNLKECNKAVLFPILKWTPFNQ